MSRLTEPLIYPIWDPKEPGEKLIGKIFQIVNVKGFAYGTGNAVAVHPDELDIEMVLGRLRPRAGEFMAIVYDGPQVDPYKSHFRVVVLRHETEAEFRAIAAEYDYFDFLDDDEEEVSVGS